MFVALPKGRAVSCLSRFMVLWLLMPGGAQLQKTNDGGADSCDEEDHSAGPHHAIGSLQARRKVTA